MDEKMKKITQLAEDECAIRLSNFAETNPPRAFSGGKVRFKEIEIVIDQLSSNIDEAEKAVGLESSCRKGCAACCTQSILVSGFDVDMILNHLERNYDQDTIKRTKQRIQEAASILDEKIGLAPRNRDELNAMTSQEYSYKAKYFDLKLPCPLLSEQQTCMVYPVRPTPCWTYRAYGDPNQCETTYDIPDSVVFGGHEKYFMFKKKASFDSGTIPRRGSYHLPGFLPQKLRDAIM